MARLRVACTFAPSRAAIPEVDIVGDHMYPLDANWMTTDAATAKAAGKVFYIGEFDWKNSQGGTPLETFLSTIESNADIKGDLYWDLRSRNASGQFTRHQDEFDLEYPQGLNSGDTTRIARLVQHAARLK